MFSPHRGGERVSLSLDGEGVMLRRFLTLLLVAACTRAPTAQPGADSRDNASRSGAAPISSGNWSTHSAIRESHRVATEVAELEKASKLEQAERTGHESCENYEGDLLRTIWRDAQGRARKLSIDAGSADSTATVDAYYDQETKLRFVFVKASAANDTVYEYRIYFGRDGHKLWEHRALARGPGYTFPSPWPSELTPRDPEARFSSSPECE
jgi:hypothetical protein